MRWLIAFALILASIALTACDPGAGITWVNETDVQLQIYLGDDLDDFDLSLAPHSSKEGATIEAVWEDVVVVRDQQSNILFRQEITWDELEAQDFRFEITEEMLSPTPTQGQ